ncbi:hypothetical protein HO133_004784 [Letharia lupina]|uniref:Uncharacterized protein n=1 Tax=Letharia lupina TaxID=560253 RepID=A0A8H6FKY5_9LECA|nr:uncharacterized protein HO133_004784 [Letharia lupina]KAF6230441.1 hypothetical protein HO133_004784 [Letharia lupina]
MTFMDSILDHRSPTTDHVFKTGIALSTHPSTSCIEPLPRLDYFLLNRLITLARPYLTKRQLKRMDYMADGRRSFYEAHHKSQVAYRDLLDAYACAETLDRTSEALRRQLAHTLAGDDDNNNNDATAATLRHRLVTLETQRRATNEDMRLRLHVLRAKAKNRHHVAAWYSDLKVVFLRDEMPWLAALGRRSYDRAAGRRGSDRGSDGGGGSAAGGEDECVGPVCFLGIRERSGVIKMTMGTDIEFS